MSNRIILSGVLAGTLLLIGLHITIVVVLGWILRLDPTMNLGWSYLSFVAGLCVLMPLACWWLLWHKQHPGLTQSFAP